MPRGVPPKAKRLHKKLLDLGWIYDGQTNGGHLRYSHPDATGPLFCSNSTANSHSEQNALRDARRLMRV